MPQWYHPYSDEGCTSGFSPAKTAPKNSHEIMLGPRDASTTWNTDLVCVGECPFGTGYEWVYFHYNGEKEARKLCK